MEKGPKTMPSGEGFANASFSKCAVEWPDRLFPDGGASGRDRAGTPRH